MLSFSSLKDSLDRGEGEHRVDVGCCIVLIVRLTFGWDKDCGRWNGRRHYEDDDLFGRQTCLQHGTTVSLDQLQIPSNDELPDTTRPVT